MYVFGGGVEVYGVGNWLEIYNKFKEKFNKTRINIKIRDKWRSLVKNKAKLKHYQKKAKKIIEKYSK